MEYTFTLDLPPSANRYWRHAKGHTYLSPEAKAYRDVAGWQARAAGCQPMAGAVGIEVKVFRARKAGDLDNSIKVLLDSLQGICYTDDKQITELHAYRHDDPKEPRVEVRCWGEN